MLEKTNLLNQRIDLYMDLTKELQPKWYNKPVVHFFLGAATLGERGSGMAGSGAT